MDRYVIVSADGHASLHAEDYRPYLDPRYRDEFDRQLPKQLSDADTIATFVTVKEVNEQWRASIEGDGLEGCWDSAIRLREMDSDGVAAEVLFPDEATERNAPPFGAGIHSTPRGADAELQWAGAHAHNRWIAEVCQEAPERRVGLACVLPFWGTDRAVEEMKWARGHGLGGVLLPHLWGEEPPYHHPQYEPIWAAAQDLDLPIHFHAGPSPRHEYFGVIEEGGWGIQGAAGAFISEVGIWVARPFTFMMWGGVFERFPGLRVAITEGGIAWTIPYLAMMDARYDYAQWDMRLGDFTSHLTMKPSEYFARHVRLGASVSPAAEWAARHAVGLELLMWGTDYPHPEGAWPQTLQRLKDTFADVPKHEVDAAVGGNAIDFYRLDRDALTKVAERIGPKRELIGC